MPTIDLNCDMGESFGAWQMGCDAELMDVVTSVNVACGFHAGDATVMRETVQMAAEKSVAIGAHPSFPDLQGFGRREMQLSAQEVFDITVYQVSALKGICKVFGVLLHHVKPHGALYNQAAKNPEMATALAEAVRAVDENLIFYGLANSFLVSEAEKCGLRTASEVFADRTYQADGSLTPRRQPNALIEKSSQAAAQVLEMIFEQTVTTLSQTKVPIIAETVCIHGDGAHALEFALEIRRKLTENGVAIQKL